jgi:periplasmic mercuric ion binding protein
LKHRPVVAALAMLFAPAGAWAAPKSITLAVPGMTCPTCPVTIKKTLLKEQGVTSVTVHYEEKELVVAFDDTKTTPEVLMKSTASIGFPSRLEK